VNSALNEPESSLTVYLSYSRTAEAEVAVIRRALEDSGFKVRPVSPRPGSAWARFYREQLDGSDVVVVVLTRNYLSSENSLLELAESLDAGKRIVPVVLDDDAVVPAVLRGYRAVDMTHGQGQGSIASVIDAVNGSQSDLPLNALEERSKVEAQEVLLRRELDAQARTIEQIKRQDEKLVTGAFPATAAIFGGTTVGAAILGPAGAVIGGIIGAGIAGLMSRVARRRGTGIPGTGSRTGGARG
jgi:hypothetical protein